ncbi:MAG: twin-arginine translocase subunit TatC [Bacteroidales bacterium]|nr:twin-arginine translocase subunit TatC [Bacteroidales bacterium]
MEERFSEHLVELRKRLIYMIISVVLTAVFVFLYPSFFVDHLLLGLLSQDFPTYRFLCWLGSALTLNDLCLQNPSFSLINTELSGQFRYHILISLVWGIILSFPFILYQLWLFIKPALYEHEIKAVRRSLSWMILFFVVGILFGYYILIPFTIQFLLHYQMSNQIQNMITIGSYFTTLGILLFWMGLSFEIPWLMYLLGRIGIVTFEGLKSYRAYIFVIILIIAGIITPTTDIFTQLLVGLPLYGLFELGLFLVRKNERKNLFQAKDEA